MLAKSLHMVRGIDNRSFENLAVCYAQGSTEEQVRGGVSLEVQRERLQAYCASVVSSMLEISASVRKLNARDRKCIPNSVEFDTGDSVDAVRRDPLLRKLRCQRHCEAASVSRSNQFFRVSC